MSMAGSPRAEALESPYSRPVSGPGEPTRIEVLMTELSRQLQSRARDALASLHQAREADDPYLAAVLLADLEGLRRLAVDHGLRIPELAVLPQP
jgi:class 3 adenylate cyclase